MKKILILSLLSLAAGVVSAQAKSSKNSAKVQVESATYVVDNGATNVVWTGKKVGGKHYGKIKVAQGTISAKGANIVGGSITIDMNSMTCDDIADAEYNGKLIGHLKNEDFFNTQSFPEAKLDITKVTTHGKGPATIAGNLTIKGITLPITFSAKIGNNGNQITASGKLVFDRTKYDVKYGSTLFGAAADKAIENNVTLDITLIANKKA